VLKPIDFDITQPMFLNYVGQRDIAVIIGNGDSSFFAEMLKAQTPFVGWAQGYINRNRSLSGDIPVSYFNHKGLHRKRLLNSNNSVIL